MSAKDTEFVLLVTPDGGYRALYDDDLRPLLDALGEWSIFRASHVEPIGTQWTADLSPVNGPVLGPFGTRQEALDAERAWLTANHLGAQEC